MNSSVRQRSERASRIFMAKDAADSLVLFWATLAESDMNLELRETLTMWFAQHLLPAFPRSFDSGDTIQET